MNTYPKKPITMLSLVEPVIRVNQFLGVFPMEIQENIVLFRWNSLKPYKTMLNLMILTLYCGFLCFQYFHSVCTGKGMVLLVVLAIWAVRTFMTMLVLFIGIWKRNQFTFFFQQCEANRKKLEGFSNCQLVVNYGRRCYKFYIFLVMVSTVFCAGQAILQPKDIYSIIYYVPEPTPALILLNCLFQIYIHIISQAAFSFIEVLCPSLARSIFGSITRIKQEMVTAVERSYPWNNENVDMDKTISPTLIVNPTVVGNNVKPKYNSPTLCPVVEEKKEDEEGTGPIMKALERLNLINARLGLINCIFGHILALNTAWLVINACLLLFLEIRYLTPSSGNRADQLGSDVNLFVVLLMAWNCLTVIIRLLLVVLSLGRVYHASRCLDNCIMNALIDIPKPHKLTHLLLIEVHLSKSATSPLAFTAAGFFVFQRETLLYVISIVTTYLVFLLQA